MTNQHPITPPPELVDQWMQDWHKSVSKPRCSDYISTKSAQWGADQELEACLLQVGDGRRENLSQVIALRNARRPKLLSDKEQALNALSLIMSRQKGMFDGKPFETIRQALEALPND
jgi:hypothetical protein